MLFLLIPDPMNPRFLLALCIIFVMVSLMAPTPNCDNKTEVEEFMKSDQFLAIYSYYSNVTGFKTPSAFNQTQEDQLESTFTAEHILPADGSVYLKQRPPKLCGKPARANFHITILSLDTINESSMTFTLDVWLTIAWFDERLRYPNSTSDYRLLDITYWQPKLWIPDIVFRNARTVQFHNLIVPNHFLVLLRNKALLYISKLTLDLTCPMNLELYPHDLQVCDLKMESMTYRTRDLILAWDTQHPVSFATENKKIETPQFTAIHNETISDCTSTYNSGNYPCISVQFFLKRRLGYHLIHSFLPSTLIVMLSWITFWIKPSDVAARFGLGLTSLLTLATLNIQSQEELPPVSYSKAIDTWMITCSLFVVLSIIEFAVVNYLTGRFPIEETILPKISPTKGVRSRIRAHWSNRRIQILAHNLDRACRFLFPVSFTIFNAYYWMTHLVQRYQRS